MITLKDYFEAVDYRITEGGDYCWRCYGSNSYSLDSWNGEFDGASAHVVFDTKTQEVFEVSVCDYSNNEAFRWVNPTYAEALKKEEQEHNPEASLAWDDVTYQDVSSVEVLAKAKTLLGT
jgi:hypothetical protein